MMAVMVVAWAGTRSARRAREAEAAARKGDVSPLAPDRGKKAAMGAAVAGISHPGSPPPCTLYKFNGAFMYNRPLFGLLPPGQP